MNKIKDIFKIPDILKDVIDELLSQKEKELIEYIGNNKKVSIYDIKKHFDDDLFVDKCLKKGIINFKDEKRDLVEAGEMYDFLSCFIVLNREKWYKYPKDFRNDVEKWYFAEYKKRKLAEIDKDEYGKQLALPIEEALKEVEGIENDFYLYECDCRIMNKNCDSSLGVCINYSGYIPKEDDLYKGKKISKDEVKELLKKADNEGLIHFFEDMHICNCCRCCCYPTRFIKEEGFIKNYPQIAFKAEINTDKCVKCKMCIKKCPMETIRISNIGDVIVDEKLCIGCGICRTACKLNAIEMKKIEEEYYEI